MRWMLGLFGALALALLGAGLLALYGLVITGVVGRVEDAANAASLAGFGAGVLSAGTLLALARARRHGQAWLQRVRPPSVWWSAALFGIAVGAGAYAARSERWPAADPALAILAVAALYFFFMRLAARWGPRNAVDARAVLAPTAWGMSGAVLIAIVVEALFFGAIVGAIYGGLYLADPELVRSAREQGIGAMIDQAGGKIAQTWTIALAVMVSYAIVAPLVEELAKVLGVMTSLRRHAPDAYTTFIGGISAGLGFAVFETLMYGLAAGDNWPLLVGIRAPGTLIHVTGTALSALGWHLQRTRGGLALLWHYGAAVLVHASWNGLTMALVITAAGTADGAEMPMGTTLAVVGVLMTMTFVLLCCLIWITLNARRLGRTANMGADGAEQTIEPGTRIVGERRPVLSGAVAGEV